jgi:hypothetical protein
MAAPKRQMPTKRVEIGLEIDVYEAIEDLLKRRRNLGNNPTDFLRRLIVAALQKHQPLKKVNVSPPKAGLIKASSLSSSTYGSALNDQPASCSPK